MGQIVRVELSNPRLLTWARESAGYGLQEIADYLNKSPEAVLAWESGTKQPTYRQLQKFAKKVRRPVSALFLTNVPDEPPPPDDFRVLPASATEHYPPEALIAFRELRASISDMRDLLMELGEPAKLGLPHWRDADESKLAERAMALRARIGISLDQQIAWPDGYAVLREWRDALFPLGVVSQQFSVPVEVFRGFSILDQGLGGVGLSSKDAPVARVFSLFHEVAHLCLRSPGVSGEVPLWDDSVRAGTLKLERACDAFAAEFLMPREALPVREAMARLAEDMSVDLAHHFGRKFKVSKIAVAYRVSDLGYADARHVWETTERWRRRDEERVARRPAGSGGDYLRTRVSRVGHSYVGKVMEAVERGVLTSYEASNMLAIRPEYLGKAHMMVS